MLKLLGSFYKIKVRKKKEDEAPLSFLLSSWQKWKTEKLRVVYTYTLDFDFIVVCSGTFTYPKTILHPDQIDFTEGAGGKVMHSSEYKNVSNDMKDRRVVVIGGSKSAADIAVHAAE